MHRDFVYAAPEVFDAIGAFTHVRMICRWAVARQAVGACDLLVSRALTPGWQAWYAS